MEGLVVGFFFGGLCLLLRWMDGWMDRLDVESSLLTALVAAIDGWMDGEREEKRDGWMDGYDMIP